MEGSNDHSFDSSMVTNLFIEKYYEQMSNEPKLLYRFYTSNGTMIHIGSVTIHTIK